MVNNKSFSQHLIKQQECAIVVIDMQERLLPVITEKEMISQNVLRLLKFAHLFNIPIIITEQEKLGSTIPEVCAEARGVGPVGKVTFDCFLTGEFEERIKKLEKETLILTGVEAHICVAQTALHACSSHRVHVLGDAIGSRTLENRNIAIERMRQAGITISSTEMFIYEVLQRAGTDEFKAALQLVK